MYPRHLKLSSLLLILLAHFSVLFPPQILAQELSVDVVTVNEGLHVLFGRGEVAGNIAASIGDDGVLLVDDQSPTLVPYIKDAVYDLGGSDIDFVINTHWHFDHADGNKVFGADGAYIIAQANSRRMLLLDNKINVVDQVLDQPAYPSVALPVLTFEDRMSIHFNGQKIDVMHFSEGHTAGDAAIIFRGDNAVHMGDVFNNAGYPFIDADSGGSLPGMIVFCEAVLAEINPGTVVIPGHGAVAGYEDLSDYIKVLSTIRDRISKLIEQGASLEEVLTAKPTAEFDMLMGSPDNFINRAFASMNR